MVFFPVPAEVAFDYLVDPHNRPEWQSSLRMVDVGSDGIGSGLTWIDVTRVPGLRPRMELDRFERPHVWSERGEWGPFSAELSLHFAAARGGCEVTPVFRAHGLGLGPLVTAICRPAVYADLRRAAGLLAG